MPDKSAPSDPKTHHPPYDGRQFSRVRGKKTGFFHVERIGDAWWLVDPNGYGFFILSVEHTSYQMTPCQATGRVPYHEFVSRKYGSEDKCEASLIESRWPAGFVCPECDGKRSSSFRREGRLYFQCTACRHQCSVISGTIFAATKLPLSRWFLAMHLLTQSKNNVAALELKRHLGVCYKTAWLVKHKLMEVMRVREDTEYVNDFETLGLRN